jgi:hypothetical protein
LSGGREGEFVSKVSYGKWWGCFERVFVGLKGFLKVSKGQRPFIWVSWFSI